MQVSSHYISNNYVHQVRYTRTRVISYFFKERVCYIYNHRFRYLTLYIQTTHTLHLFTERGTTDYTDWHRGAQRRILRYVLSDRYSRKQKDDTHGNTIRMIRTYIHKSDTHKNYKNPCQSVQYIMHRFFFFVNFATDLLT